MEKIRETFLKKYGVWEYIFIAGGVVIFSTIIYWFVTKQLEATTLNGIAFIASIFMIGAPKYILDWGRKKVGLNVKSDKNENNAS